MPGYAGDVWDVQPAPKDHPWRTITNPLGGGNGMTPHYSGTTLDAQARYAAGTKDILSRFLAGEPQQPQNVIVENGDYATKACESLPVPRTLFSPAELVGLQMVSASRKPNFYLFLFCHNNTMYFNGSRNPLDSNNCRKL